MKVNSNVNFAKSFTLNTSLPIFMYSQGTEHYCNIFLDPNNLYLKLTLFENLALNFCLCNPDYNYLR